MFKTVAKDVWAFDVEWVPDADTGLKLHQLPQDVEEAEVFEAMWNGEGNAISIIESKDLKQVTDSGKIEKIIDETITENSPQVEQYKKSSDEKKQKLISFFVGQIMKKSKGKANPKQVNKLLKEKLDN